MAPQSPQSDELAPIEAAHRHYHGYEPSLDGEIAKMYVAGMMMIVATTCSIFLFTESVIAVQGIYGWYPQFAAQQWFIYDELLTVFSFSELIFGALASALIFARRSLQGAVTSAMACTLSVASTFVVSLVQPLALFWQSLVYYLLPLFMAPLAGTLLTYLRREETQQPKTEPSLNQATYN